MFIQKVVILLVVLAAFAFAGTTKDVKAVVTIQATNNTAVPNIVYTVDAVQCLQEAYSIYVDETARGEAYAELYEAKHPGNWSVAIGYTTLISRSTIYVETLVSESKDLQSDKKGVLYRIFN